MDWFSFVTTLIKIVGFTFAAILGLVSYTVYAERRVSAIIQDRVGPNRVGLPLTLLGFKKDVSFLGLFQPLADGIKFILKEDFTPAHVKKFYFWLAPALCLVPGAADLCGAALWQQHHHPVGRRDAGRFRWSSPT